MNLLGGGVGGVTNGQDIHVPFILKINYQHCSATLTWRLVSSSPGYLNSLCGDRGDSVCRGEKMKTTLAVSFISIPLLLLLREGFQ